MISEKKKQYFEDSRKQTWFAVKKNIVICKEFDDTQNLKK